MSFDEPQMRSIEESFSHAHDAAGRAEHLVGLIIDDLNGNAPGAMGTTQPSPSFGLVSSADRLAGRVENLCRELEGIRAKLVSNTPKTVSEFNNARQQLASTGYADRHG